MLKSGHYLRDSKPHLLKVGTCLFSLVVFFGVIFPKIAGATIYQPGETLAPDCAPGSVNCGVALFGLNGQSGISQALVIGATGTDFSISSNGNIHTFNLPSASALNRGLLTALDWSTFNSKQGALGYTPLNPANNLSDLASTLTARTNLGLGALATQNGTFSGTSSGTNTGDQTTITGNAGTATALQTGRMINGVTFDGSANITVAAAAGTLTGSTLASGITASSLTSFGTLSSLALTGAITGATGYNGLVITPNTGVVTSGTWNGTTMAVANGGTGTTNGSIAGSGALAFTSNTTNALTLDSGTTGAINIGTNANAKTINIGTGTAGNTVNIGSDNTTADTITVGSALDTATIGAGTFRITNPGAQLNGSTTLCINANRVRIGASNSNCNTSSLRFKHDIQDLNLGLETINALRPVDYSYNDTNTYHLGLIAEDVYPLIPTAVVLDTQGLPYALDYNEITPVIINAIQEQSAVLGDVAPKVKADGSGNGLSTLVATIQSETAHNPLAIIAKKISDGTRFLTDFVAARVTAIRGYFDQVFAKKVHTEQLCVKKSDGSEVCVTGDQLNSLLQKTKGSPAPTTAPTSSGTLPVVNGSTPQPSPDATTATKTRTDTPPTLEEATVTPEPTPSVAGQPASPSSTDAGQ